MNILLASPRGFCAGVTMAIETLNQALHQFGSPIYVYHEIVHNRSVVEDFRDRGVVFVDRIEDVPVGSHLLFSAHGVSPAIRKEAETRNLITVDATCPLVRKVHMEAVRFLEQDRTVFLIGHAGHDEVEGTLGVAPGRIVLVETQEDVEGLQADDPKKTAYVTQTTLSVDDANRIIQRLRAKFPEIIGPAKDDICYATQNRQDALRQLTPEADLVIVVGSANSSNSSRLVELARMKGKQAYLVDGPDELCEDWFQRVETVLVTAGASAPEHRVQACLRWIQTRFPGTIDEITLNIETAYFPLPAAVRKQAGASTTPDLYELS